MSSAGAPDSDDESASEKDTATESDHFDYSTLENADALVFVADCKECSWLNRRSTQGAAVRSKMAHLRETDHRVVEIENDGGPEALEETTE